MKGRSQAQGRTLGTNSYRKFGLGKIRHARSARQEENRERENKKEKNKKDKKQDD
jgi:hypothetical protein